MWEILDPPLEPICFVFRQYYDSLECYKTHTTACPDIIASMKPVIDNRKSQVGKECRSYEAEMLQKYKTTTTTTTTKKPNTSRLNDSLTEFFFLF